MRRRTRKLASLIGAAALATGALLVLTPTSSGALTQITLSTNADSGAGSLRQAFIDASSGGTAAGDDVEIIIPASVGDITLTTGVLQYDGGTSGSQSLTVRGAGNTITQTTFTFGVIDLTGGTTFTVDSLTITGGRNASDGGAIRSPGGTDLVITNATLTDNRALGSGGAIHMFGDLTLTNSTISDNHALGAAGGVFAAGVVTMTGSTISGNTASTGGGLHFGDVNTTATITNSTITGNTAGGDAGGILADDPLVLRYATITGNTSGSGGANIHFRGSDTLTSFGSVVAVPLGGGVNCSGQGSTTSQGYNFEDTNSCGFGAGTGDQTNAGSPQLGALASNGGPTQTMAPAAGSGLVDKIPALSPCGGVNITVDQRGLPRPVTAGQFCDIGAYEIQVAALDLTPSFVG